MSKQVAIITDTHFGVRNQSSVFLDHQATMLADFFDDCDQRDIREIWHLGDFFDDRKKVSSKLLLWVREHWQKPIAERGIRVHMIIGNHDVYFKNTNTPNTVDVVLGNDPNHTIYENDIGMVDFCGRQVAFCPWISPENTELLTEKLHNEYYDILLGHFDIQGMFMQSNVLSTHGMKVNEFTNHKLVLSGHYHKKSESDNIMYLGNPLPTNWAEASDVHGWHFLKEDQSVPEFRMYESTLYQKITIDTNEKIKDTYNGSDFVRLILNSKNEFHYQVFLEYLRGFDISHLSIIDNSAGDLMDNNDALINEEELRDDIISMLKDYVDKISDDDAEANSLKKLFQQLKEDADAV